MAPHRGRCGPPAFCSGRVTLREKLRSRPHPKRGEVWKVFTPAQPDQHQPRYALVISDDIRNEVADDFLVVPIFSRGRGVNVIPISAEEAGIEHDSVLFCEEVTCLYEDNFADGPFCVPVRPALLRQVVQAIVRAITPWEEQR